MSRQTEQEVARRKAGSAPTGLALGLGAYLWWGLVPIYFKVVAKVPALEVLAHRVVWSLIMLVVLVFAQRKQRDLVAAMRSRATLSTFLKTTVLIAVNWLIFIWAVAQNRLVEASLGYFINPLVNVLLGVVFLGERVRGWKLVSVALAAAGVGWLTFHVGSVPWVSLVLAGSFGLYGLLRKLAPQGAVIGLSLETGLLLPVAAGYLIWLAAHGRGAFGRVDWTTDLLLVAAGVVTAAPLLAFAGAVRRLKLSTLGFLQYVAPTGQFLLAVLAYGEPFTHDRAIAFALIWTGLAVYAAASTRELTRATASR